MDVGLLVAGARAEGKCVAGAGSGDVGHELLLVEEPGPELVVGGVQVDGLVVVGRALGKFVCGRKTER